MDKRFLNWAAAAVAVIVVIAGVVKFASNKAVAPSGKDNKAAENNLPAEPAVNTLSGVLRKTDDIERGTLYLVTSDKKIYINTTRDYSFLAGKEVTVEIEGDLQSFKLVDIKAK